MNESNLITIKTDRDKNYVTVNPACAQDENISWKAKGIHFYFISRPPNWNINSADLKKRSTDGPSSLSSGIDELIANQYLFRTVKRNEKKQIIKWGFLATEKQSTKEYVKQILKEENNGWSLLEDKKLLPEKLLVENLLIGNPTLNNNKNININKPNNSSFLKEFKKEEYMENSPDGEFSDNTPEIKNPPVRKLQRKTPITNKPSLRSKKSFKEISTELSSSIAKKITTEKIIKPKAVPQKASEEIIEVIELWSQLGFKRINPDRAPKTFNKTIAALKKIQRGKLIPDEKRQFSIEDIKDSMVKYSLIAFDPEYGPSNPEIKKALQNKSLEAFLYCPGFKNKGNKIISWMVKCYDDPPLTKTIQVETVEEKYPRITLLFKRFYCDHVLCGMKKKFLPHDEMKFRKAANRVGDAYFKLDRMLLGVRDPDHLAELFCQSVAKSFGSNISKIYPGSMGSNFAIERMLAYLQEKEMIENHAREKFYKIFN